MIAHIDKAIAAQGEDTILARTIFGEARGEAEEGQTAVAYTVKHRAALAAAHVKAHGAPHPLFGDGSIAAACLSSSHGVHQYSCWNETDPSRLAVLNVTYNNPMFVQCLHIAQRVIEGRAQDRLPETTHYFAPGHVPDPAWATGLPGHAIGRHRFYRNVP